MCGFFSADPAGNARAEKSREERREERREEEEEEG